MSMFEIQLITTQGCYLVKHLHLNFLILQIFLVFSTIPNYVSQRSKKFGAWFIQALIEKIEMHGNDADLLLF